VRGATPTAGVALAQTRRVTKGDDFGNRRAHSRRQTLSLLVCWGQHEHGAPTACDVDRMAARGDAGLIA